ncbi:MAG TPA: phage replisome organizer N-terminal domain-containing protein [Candidatus Onthousia faecipullorum]|uniref:Phage replisome organizer N-terminal domain-containing protein n=1 Tax=Candidatus Onthousia faecipullorum TaxID=2840887 RepID=A0A9D1GDG7_9FIRM|nr:phage replisome organizer N-terminal domain-containing protein [Candidatus Onthousia faecipullorum]
MSKYDTTKFSWLMLNEDFFDDDAIQWLEEQPNGKEYSLFYLKLCLKSLKTNGILIRQVGQMLVPYDASKLAELTRIDVDTVVVAMELLQKIGLVEILENGEIYLSQIQNMIGSKSIGAFKKQQQRMLKNEEKTTSGQEADKCPPEIRNKNKEIRNKNIDINLITTTTTNITKYIEDNFKRDIVPLEKEKIKSWLSVFDETMIKKAVDIAILNNKFTFAYISGILNNWEKAGISSLEDIESKETKYKNKEPTDDDYKEIYDYDWLEDESEDTSNDDKKTI